MTERQVEYRRLGRTDLRLSLIGFGGSPLGNVYAMEDPNEERSAVDLAIERGINFFDVSPYYGITLAEQRLGEALAGKRDKVILSTKCGRYGKAEFDFSAKRIAGSIEESLKRLRTGYVDLFFAHDVEFGDVQQIIEETIPAMRRIQEQGKARYIGISGYPLRILARIAQAVPLDAILSYCHYNLMATDMDEVLTPLAEKLGIGLINAGALNMGLLTENGAPDWHPAPERLRSAGREAAEHCRKRGVNLSELALGFCFSHPYVSSTLVGMSSRRDVEADLSVLENANHNDVVKEVREILAPVFNYTWPSGRPENNE